MRLHYPLNSQGAEDAGQLPWKDGVPSTGVEGSYPGHAIVTDLEAELLSMIDLAGLVRSGADLTQGMQAVARGIWLGQFGGTATALTATLPNSAVLPSLQIGMRVRGIAASDYSGSGGTLAITGIGAAGTTVSYPIVAADGTSLASGAWKAGQFLTFDIDGSSNARFSGGSAGTGSVSSGGLSVGLRGLTGSSAGGAKTANFAVKRIAAATAAGTSYRGANLAATFNGATTGAGGMDTGAMPAFSSAGTGWLALYWIYNPTSQAWAILGCAGATSSDEVYTGQNMPAGYTASVKIGSYVLDGSGNFRKFRQLERTVEVDVYAMGSSFSSPAPNFAQVGDLSPAVPYDAAAWLPEAQQMSTGAAANIYLAPTAEGIGAAGMVSMWSTTNQARASGQPVRLLAPYTAYQAVTQGQTWAIWVRGYVF
ncbi:hypothetical protein [Methylobacterium sp. GC_Met_2]|uniref:hypothetical protein n=1 Tax=Methylobacterium sp. GC_Met_2 TaxID=2937376 RepID=UPI00226B86AF|nr:hypothetical protein [Methylobacterium sp. GC_Met_2]